MKITKSWVGKKEPTNPDKKEAHLQRRLRRTILNEIKDEEWQQQILDYKKNTHETTYTDE